MECGASFLQVRNTVVHGFLHQSFAHTVEMTINDLQVLLSCPCSGACGTLILTLLLPQSQ